MHWIICWDCDCCPRSVKEHTLTTCRANMNSVASAGVTPSKSGKQLAINRKLELLFLFKSAPRTVPRPEVIWRGRQELGILYRFCRLVSVPVSAPWAVYSTTSIYRMDFFFVLLTFGAWSGEFRLLAMDRTDSMGPGPRGPIEVCYDRSTTD
jgi:hypothetical protein